MKKINAIKNRIDKEDISIVLVGKINWTKKLRSLYPEKNIFILYNLSSKFLDVKDKKNYTLIISKRKSKKVEKNEWKKVITY